MPFRPLRPEEKLYFPKPCQSHEHEPPTMIVLKPGHHVYVCPACGKETHIDVPEIRC